MSTRIKSKSTDLTEGGIAPLLLRFALPILVGQIFQNLYNSVDSIVVGQFVGTSALAAVTSSGDISNLLVAFFTGLSAGAGVLFSRFYGAKDQKNLHDAIHTALTFSCLLGAAMAAVGVLVAPGLLRLVSCPEEVYLEARLYLRIYLCGILFTAIYNVGAGVLRAVGDSRDPFLYLVIASLTNMALDVLLVAGLHMGVMGVAVATVCSQFLSVVLVFRNMLRTEDVYKVRVRDLRIDRALLVQIIDLGLPAGIQSCIISISNFFIQRFVNMAGPVAMGGIGSAKKLDRFAGIIANSMGLATATFVSQNVGAKRMDRAFRGSHVSLGITCAISGVMCVLLYVFAERAVSLFTPNREAVAYGAAMLRVMMPFYLLQILNAIYSNVVRGFGRSRAVMVLSILGMAGCRQLFLQLTMARHFDVNNIYYGYPVGWGCASLFVIVYYLITIVLPYRRKKAAGESA